MGPSGHGEAEAELPWGGAGAPLVLPQAKSPDVTPLWPEYSVRIQVRHNLQVKTSFNSHITNQQMRESTEVHYNPSRQKKTQANRGLRTAEMYRQEQMTQKNVPAKSPQSAACTATLIANRATIVADWERGVADQESRAGATEKEERHRIYVSSAGRRVSDSQSDKNVVLKFNLFTLECFTNKFTPSAFPLPLYPEPHGCGRVLQLL